MACSTRLLPAATVSRAVQLSATSYNVASTLWRCKQACCKTWPVWCALGPGGRTSRFFRTVKAQQSEAAAAAEAAAKAGLELNNGAPSIFDRIVRREIPATIVYEDETVLGFRDINPQAPVHVVLVPKSRDGLTQLAKAEERHKVVLGHLLYVATKIAQQEALTNGYRVVINDGPDGCQSVYHLHLHVMGGRQLKWPPG